MNSYKLSFCKTNKIDDSIAEIIINEGVELDTEMLKELHKWFENNLAAPCGILVNKINKYTYTFKAQLKLLDLPILKAAAVITYSNISTVATESLKKLPTNNDWNLRTFDNREEALEWIKAELKNDKALRAK